MIRGDLPESAYARADFIQASDSADMESAFRQKLARLTRENLERAKDGKAPLGILDVSLASAAGDVFVMQFLLSDKVTDGWVPNSLDHVDACFWMAADAESLDDYQEAAIASLRSRGPLGALAMGVAGGKSRFMAFLAGKRLHNGEIK